MKRVILLFLVTITSIVQVMSQNAEACLQQGVTATANGNFEEGKVYLEKAYELGSKKACGWLAFGYLSGFYSDVKPDYVNATKWVNKGFMDPMCRGIGGIIGFNIAKTKKEKYEYLPTFLSVYNNGWANSHVGNLISICYLLKGDAKKAEEWAEKITEKEENGDEDEYMMAYAILAKLALDAKEFFTATILAKQAEEYGNPLAQYVLGRAQIELNMYPAVGRQRVKEAALYDYNSWLDIDVFDEEINKYYQSIKNKIFLE